MTIVLIKIRLTVISPQSITLNDDDHKEIVLSTNGDARDHGQRIEF